MIKSNHNQQSENKMDIKRNTKRKKTDIKRIAFFVAIALFLLFELYNYLTAPKPVDVSFDNADLIVEYVDVGQGDCAIVKTKSGKSVLVDAGTSKSYSDLKAEIDALEISHFDYMIFTHPHSDHIGGAYKVVGDYSVGEIFMPDVTNTTNEFEKLLDTIDKKDLSVTVPSVGDKILFDDCEIEFFAPISDNYKSLNDYSLVFKLTYKDSTFLFCGDAESTSEKEMLKYFEDKLDSDVIKLGHHGSSSSSTKKFIDAVSPECAIISCGKDNDYGHPHKETVDLLNKKEIEYYRTDECGNIFITTDGENLSVICDEVKK